MHTRSFVTTASHRARWAGLSLQLGVLLAGCAGDETTPHLLGSQEEAPESNAKRTDAGPGKTTDEEEDRLRKLMAVRIIDIESTDACFPACPASEVCYRSQCVPRDEPVEVSAQDVQNDLFNHCVMEVIENSPLVGGFPECDPVIIALDECSPCRKRVDLCQVNRLLDIAGLRSTPLRVNATDTTSYSVPLQSTPTSASLALAAREWAHLTTDSLLKEMRSIFTDSTPNCTPAALPSKAAALLDAVSLYEQANDLAMDNILASSDAQLASTPSLSEAAARAVAGSALSRVAAAHLVTGGDPGLVGSTTEAFCDDPKLTPQARRAVSVFRLAAVAPTDILREDLSLDALLEGDHPPVPECTAMVTTNCCTETSCDTSGGISFGSVRQRLDELYGAGLIDELEALGVGDGIVGVSGLHRDDFEQARNYLRQEIRAFNRSLTAILRPRQLIGDRVTTFPRFAGTASPPPNRPAAYWAAIASYEDHPLWVNPPGSAPRTGLLPHHAAYTSWVMPSLGNLLEDELQDADPQFPDFPATFGENLGAPGLAHYLGEVYAQAANIRLYVEDGSVDPSVREQTQQALVPLLTEGAQRFYGVVRLHRNAGDELRVYLPTPLVDSDKRLVIGEDGLECALNGSIEGAECDLEATNLTLTNLLTPEPGQTRRYLVTNPDWPTHLQKRLYFVRRVNGNYEVLGVLNAPNLDEDGSAWMPLVPEVFEKAANALRPSDDWCTRSDVSCAGETFDARLPLEDELSHDGDAVESSWRHYLTLARQAADEADLLGESVLDLTEQQILREEQQQLAQIQRAEHAIEELQEICGVSVDPTDLIKVFSADGTKDFSLMRSGPGLCGGRLCPVTCSSNMDCGVDPNYQCLGGTCQLACVNDAGCPGGMRCIGDLCTWDPVAIIEGVAAGAAGFPSMDVSSANRLSECLGGDTLDLATLGSEALCVWHNTDDPRRICEIPPNETLYPCPILRSEVTNCSAMQRPPNTTAKEIPLENALSLFVNAEPGPAPLDCDLVRTLRQDPGFKGAVAAGADPGWAAFFLAVMLEQIRASEVFHPDRIQGLGAGIGWEPDFGGYSTITRGGAPVYSTGTAAHGPASSGWPCDDATLPDVCDATAGTPNANALFCAAAQCDNLDERAAMNERMMRAALSVAIMSGGGVSKNFKFPVYYYTTCQDPDSPISCPSNETQQQCFVDVGGEHISYWHTDFDTGSQFCHAPHYLVSQRNALQRGLSGTVAPLRVNMLDLSAECPEEDVDPGSIEDKRCGTFGRDYVFDFRGTEVREAWRAMSAGTPVSFPEFALDLFNQDGASSGLRGWRFGIESTIGDIDGPIGGSPKTHLFAGLSASFGGPRRIFASGEPVSYFYFALSGTDTGIYDLGDLNVPLPRPTPDDWRFGWQNPVRVPLMAPFTFTKQNLLDGLELLCEAAKNRSLSCASQPPVVANAADIELSQDYLRCLADQIDQNLAMTVLAGVPVRAIVAMRTQAGLIGTFPALGGTYGQKVNDLAVAIRVIRDTVPALADTVRSLATDLEAVKIEVSRAEKISDLAAVNAKITMINQELSETQSILGAIGGAISGGISGAAAGPYGAIAGAITGSAFGIANTLAVADANEQISDALDRAVALQGALADTGVDSAINNLNAATNSRVRDLHDLSRELRQAVGSLSTALSAIENERERARRALYRGMLLDSDVMKTQYEATRFMRARLNTARTRYVEAHRNARRMAFFARRAIEQRLGVDLSLIADDLPLVEAPSTWVDSICATTGTNLADDVEQLGENFADAYIGDYVTRLENVVESYRIINNFHEGNDTAVISLRDDVQNVREECLVPVDNLLKYSGDLTNGVWQTFGCPEPLEDPEEFSPQIACAGASEIQLPEEGPFPATWPDYSKAGGFRVTFGDGLNVASGACPAGECEVTSETRIAQVLSLPAGRYRLSWYGRGVMRMSGGNTVASLPPSDAVDLISEAPLDVSPVEAVFTEDETLWNRFFMVFELAEDADVEVAIVPLLGRIEGGQEIVSQQVDLAAFMLEDLTDDPPLLVSATPLPRPKPYMGTKETSESMLPICEDTDGSTFRRDHWQRRCMKLCRDGLRENCVSSAAETHCYWETLVSIGQRDIDDSRILKLSGFARGNFNYRIAALGLNFVGTGTRDCSTSTTPSACYAGGFIPYSITHLGPYFVRNYDGEDYKAELFTGRIEHARGLAAERYLTNPLSSADRELITPYMRSELNGRPLDGTFAIRVWEEEGVSFESIEDVQLVLDYRYWTRFH